MPSRQGYHPKQHELEAWCRLDVEEWEEWGGVFHRTDTFDYEPELDDRADGGVGGSSSSSSSFRGINDSTGRYDEDDLGSIEHADDGRSESDLERGVDPEGAPLRVVDKTQCARQQRAELRRMMRRAAAERESARQRELVRLQEIALELAACPHCPLIHLDAVDGSVIRALYAHHLTPSHSSAVAHVAERAQEQSMRKEESAQRRVGRTSLFITVRSRGTRADGSTVLGLEALPSDVFGVVFSFCHPLALLAASYASKLLEREAEASGAWDVVWGSLRVFTTLTMNIVNQTIRHAVTLTVNWAELQRGALSASRRRIAKRMTMAAPQVQLQAPQEGDDPYEDEMSAFMQALFDPGAVIHNDAAATATLRRGESYGRAFAAGNDGSGSGGRVFPRSSLLSFRFQLCTTLLREWESWDHDITRRSFRPGPAWPSLALGADFRTRLYGGPQPGSPIVTEPCDIVADSPHHLLVRDQIIALKEHVAVIAATAWLELMRDPHLPPALVPYCALKANEAAGMPNVALHHAEKICFTNEGFPHRLRLLCGAPETVEAWEQQLSSLRLRALDRRSENERDVTLCDIHSFPVHVTGREVSSADGVKVWAPPAPFQSKQSHSQHISGSSKNVKEAVDRAGCQQKRLEKQVKNMNPTLQGMSEYEKLKMKMVLRLRPWQQTVVIGGKQYGAVPLPWNE